MGHWWRNGNEQPPIYSIEVGRGLQFAVSGCSNARFSVMAISQEEARTACKAGASAASEAAEVETERSAAATLRAEETSNSGQEAGVCPATGTNLAEHLRHDVLPSKDPR